MSCFAINGLRYHQIDSEKLLESQPLKSGTSPLSMKCSSEVSDVVGLKTGFEEVKSWAVTSHGPKVNLAIQRVRLVSDASVYKFQIEFQLRTMSGVKRILVIAGSDSSGGA